MVTMRKGLVNDVEFVGDPVTVVRCVNVVAVFEHLEDYQSYRTR